jgi:YD repeat-containing protein
MSSATSPQSPVPEILPARRNANREFRNLLVFGLIVAVAAYAWWRHGRIDTAKFALAHLHGNAPAPHLDGTHPCVSAPVVGGVAAPALSRCATPTTHTAADTFQVDLRYGTFVLRQTDLQLNDEIAYPLTRSYNSQNWGDNAPRAFGRLSNHPYDIAPEGTRRPYTLMMLMLEDNDFLYFNRISPGGGFENAVFQHTETSTRFYKATINWNGDGWTLRLTDGSEVLFPEAYNARNMAQGASTRMRSATGATLQLVRNARRDLQLMKTDHGHWIRFTYDEFSRVIRAEDDRGNWVRYGYGSGPSGMLLYAIHSSGAERHYEYEGLRMIAITDQHATVLLRNTYENNAVVRQEYANGDVYEYRYLNPARHAYADSVVVTLPDHRQVEVLTADSVPDYMKQ